MFQKRKKRQQLQKKAPKSSKEGLNGGSGWVWGGVEGWFWVSEHRESEREREKTVVF